MIPFDELQILIPKYADQLERERKALERITESNGNYDELSVKNWELQKKGTKILRDRMTELMMAHTKGL